MTSPMSDYSDDAQDFLNDYKKKIRSDSRLEDHQDIVEDFNSSYERAFQLLNTFQAEAYKDVSYYLGNQWSLEELSYLNNQRRASFTYNKIRRLINLVYGYQCKNRLATIATPVTNSSEETATLITDGIRHIMENASGYENISTAFKGALTSGISFLSPWLDYRHDPVNGDIKFHLDDWNAVMFDPFLTKRDLSDCTFVARRKYLGRSEVISLLPDKQDIIEALPWGSRDDKFTYMPYARQWGMQKLLNYNEYWRTRWETKDVLVDMRTGETKEWKGDRKRLHALRQMFPYLDVIKKPVRSVDLGIIVEGELLYYGKDPWGLDDYPFVPFFAIFEPSYDLYSWKIQSLVRIVRDPQTELNKRRSKMVDMIDNQLATGFIAKNNSVTNPSSLYKTGQGQVIWLKPEAQMTDVQKIVPPDIPASLFQLEAEFEKDIMEIAGVNSELFGMSENDKVETAGILAKMRQGAGLVNLQDLFDGLRESQKLLGQKTFRMMQANYSPEKMELITGRKVTPDFYSAQFCEYNIVVEEGILTDSQREMQFMQLMALKMGGVQIPDSMIVAYSNLHDKKELSAMFAQQAQEAQNQAKMAADLQMQQQATVTRSLDAKAASDKALAAERINKLGLDAALNAERMARAEEEHSAEVLNLVRAVKEIQGMDLENLMQKVQILKELEGKASEKSTTSSAA